MASIESENISEKNTRYIFEVLGIPLSKISESDCKRPDFEGEISDRRILVEVKEIRENPNEKNILNSIDRNNIVSMSVNLDGKRFRKDFSDANRQLKKYSNETDFCIIAIEDIRDFFVRSESPILELHQAMYGEYTSWINIDDRSVCIDAHGKKRALNSHKNTTISCAVLVIGNKDKSKISAVCIHNRFAKNPFPEGVFAQGGYREYKSKLNGKREQLIEIN